MHIYIVAIDIKTTVATAVAKKRQQRLVCVFTVHSLQVSISNAFITGCISRCIDADTHWSYMLIHT